MRRWKDEWDRILEERFADELNADLAKELGCGERTLVRHARKLGLEKSEAFKRMTQERSKRGSELWYEYMHLTGQKIGNHGSEGRRFQKGHRFEGDVEARRIKAIQDRAWDERVRLIRGFARKTKWKMSLYEGKK